MNNPKLRAIIILSAILFLALACSGREESATLSGCENAPRPVVFVHGFIGGGDNFANTVMRFASNDYCPAYLHAFDWNTLSFDMGDHVDALESFIQEVLRETGADQADLVGHSMGGWLSQQYLADEARAAQVAHYVHAASFCGLPFPDAVPLLVLSSDEDTAVGPCTIEGAQNQDLEGADHLQVVTVPEAFAAMYRFFNDGQSPETTRVLSAEQIALSGKVLAFGTNQPAVEARVEIYALDAATGERLHATPAARFVADENGNWGPFQAELDVHYEFEVSRGQDRPLHYYRQTFPRSNPLVYLRVWPESNPLLDVVLGNIRYDDGSSNVVLFSANQALYHGRDAITLDGLDLTTPEMAPPPPDSASTIAIFISDADGDGQTDGGPVPIQFAGFSFMPGRDTSVDGESPSEFPFLRQYDAFLDASTRRTVTLTMNGATLRVPTWKGDSEGIIIVVFEHGQEGL